MSEICKNCTGEIALNFCPNCGQKKTKRIDRAYIKDEIQYTVLHMNKGFLYSIKKTLKAPGKTAREFVEGNRVNHYKPILLVFVVSGISAFLANTLVHPGEVMQQYYQMHPTKYPFDINALNTFIYKYQAILMLVSIPFMAFFTWLAFRKWGYNYYENIVITAYSMVCLQVISILTVVPLQLLLKNNPDLFMIIPTILTMLLTFIVIPWFYIDLYNNKSAGEVIMRLFLLAVLLFVVYILLIIIGVIVFLVYCNATGVNPRTLLLTP